MMHRAERSITGQAAEYSSRERAAGDVSPELEVNESI